MLKHIVGSLSVWVLGASLSFSSVANTVEYEAVFSDVNGDQVVDLQLLGKHYVHLLGGKLPLKVRPLIDPLVLEGDGIDYGDASTVADFNNDGLCSGQLKLANSLEVFKNNSSAAIGDKPSLF